MKAKEIESIGVIGTGMIGPDISLAAAMAGYPVTMVGRTGESIERGLARFRKNLQSLALCFAALVSADENRPVQPGSVRNLPAKNSMSAESI